MSTSLDFSHQSRDQQLIFSTCSIIFAKLELNIEFLFKSEVFPYICEIMLKYFVLAILSSLICGSFALDQTSPVLIFGHNENTKTIPKVAISATTYINQRDFEELLQTFVEDQPIVMFVADDLSPEKFNAKDDKGVRAFENLANDMKILEYIPYVKNAVDNIVTNGKSVDNVKVSTTNEMEPKPSADSKFIIVNLPECLPSELDFHCLSRYDRIIHAITQLDTYKDFLFILSSKQNARLQNEEHSRKRRAAANVKNSLSHKNALVYFKDFFERSKVEPITDTSVSLSVTGVTLKDNVIEVQFSGKYEIVLSFEYNPSTESWQLSQTSSRIGNQQINASSIGIDIAAPRGFSFSCTSSVYIPLDNNKDVAGVYFQNFQIQFNFDNQDGEVIARFGDSYDCVGFTNAAIWAGLFISFLLLFIMSTGITYIMDIRTMDRFDDPKGKTITVTASE